MKKYNLFCAAIITALAACAINAEPTVTWNENGQVTNSAGHQLQLQITGIYDSLSYRGDTYLAGFKINKNGDNVPTIAQVNNLLTQINYWDFAKIPNDIFAYQNQIHFVDTNGGVYQLGKSSWHATPLVLPPGAQVVNSDNNSQLIVCYPASLAKSVVRESGCKSMSNTWALNFVWSLHLPKMCAGKLYAIATERGTLQLKKVDIATGSVFSSQNIDDIPPDICTL